MRRILTMLAVLALVGFAAPVMAQQPTTGQEKTQDSLTAGEQGMTRDTSKAAPTGVTQRAGQETTPTTPTETTPTETGAKTGAEMPTTASPLPSFLVAGVALLGLGLGLRYLSGRA
jgi:cytoskeletal protein RodZ